MPVLGQLDLIHQNHAIGWALDTERPQQRLHVEIVRGDEVIAIGVAERLHKVLAAKKIGDGKYGFVISLPSRVSSGSHGIRARVAGAGAWLRGEHVVPSVPSGNERTKMAGSIDGISSGVIFGWATAESLTVRPTIEIRCGKRLIGHASIGAPRSDIAAQGLADFACSFTFDLTGVINGKRTDEPFSLVNAATGQTLAGSPVSLTQRGYGHAEKLTGIDIHGWATLAAPHAATEHAVVEAWIDGCKVLDLPADQPRSDFAQFGFAQARCGFKLTIPSRYLDGRPHALVLRHQATGAILSGGEQAFTATLRHAVVYANNSVVAGWAFIEQAPTRLLALEAWENGKRVAKAGADQAQPCVPDEQRREFGVRAAGFALSLPAPADPHQARRISVRLAGDCQPIGGKDILIASRAELVGQAEKAARQDEAFRWWARELIEQLRRSEAPDGTLFKEIPARSDATVDATVDIIVPVYKGLEETLICLHSLLAAHDATACQIIVINDASPDAALSQDLRALADTESRLTLLENEHNFGFVATVNRGMALHPERDVVLLNADTVISAGDWLRRLRAAAYAEMCIATATPFSNRATICSLPLPNVDNDLPAGCDVTALDSVCATTNPGVRIDIPTAVGFCMFIKRAALNEVGLFDAQRWARGYGEENDFCLKAAAIGWKHVAACDVFVQHHGAVSFQNEKQVRIQENLDRLNALYPDYSATIDHFIRRDPLSGPRSRVALQLARSPASRRKAKQRQTLHVTHAWGGGVQYHVERRCAKSGLILRPTRDGRAEIVRPDGDLALSLPLAELETLDRPDAAVLEIFRALDINAIHMHQWIGFPPAIWQLPAALGVPLDFTVHDYYAFCPRVHMLDHTGQYCGQAPVSRCAQCVKARPLEAEVGRAFAALSGSIDTWRAFHQKQLAAARHIFAPCEDAARRIRQAFQLGQVTVKPHDEPPLHFAPKPLPEPDAELRVAVIGAIGPNKGYDLLLAVAQRAEVEAPRLRFVIVGYTMDDAPFETLSNVRITGKYAADELPSLLMEADCHVALFLSPWPETYSYTLSEALRAELTPVAPALGAMGERVHVFFRGGLLPENMTPDGIVKMLRALSVRSGQRRVSK